jgi:hypothetical protein
MCSNTDLISHSGTPLLKAYETGSTTGSEILIERSSEVLQDVYMDKVLQQVATSLSLKFVTNASPLGRHESIDMTASTRKENYDDALQSFILTLQYNIYEEKGNKSRMPVKLSKNKSHVLQDFLDLCIGHYHLLGKFINFYSI